MRIIFKPEISSWSIFWFSGKGFAGEFWLLPLLILFALSIVYIEGRGKVRQLYHTLLFSWHAMLTGLIIYGSTQPKTDISFGTWGVSVSLTWLVIPFLLFLAATVLLIYKERINLSRIPVYSWTTINIKPLILAMSLSIIALVFFWFGTGFNWLVKIAVGSTILQWILLTEAFGKPYKLVTKKDLT
jgi:cytochrome c oxidase assembly factor CtaG